MGVEHFLVCNQCKEFIDLHKSYEFGMVVQAQRPTVGIDCEEIGFSDVKLRGTYWESRGLWFLWHHRSHVDVNLYHDVSDDWFDLEPYLKEVFPHDEDLKIRERVRV